MQWLCSGLSLAQDMEGRSPGINFPEICSPGASTGQLGRRQTSSWPRACPALGVTARVNVARGPLPGRGRLSASPSTQIAALPPPCPGAIQQPPATGRAVGHENWPEDRRLSCSRSWEQHPRLPPPLHWPRSMRRHKQPGVPGVHVPAASHAHAPLQSLGAQLPSSPCSHPWLPPV